MILEKKLNLDNVGENIVFLNKDVTANNDFKKLYPKTTKTTYHNSVIFNDSFLNSNMTLSQNLNLILNPIGYSKNSFFDKCNSKDYLKGYKNKPLNELDNNIKLEFKILLFLFMHKVKNAKFCIIEKDINFIYSKINSERIDTFEDLWKSNNTLCFPPNNKLNKNHSKFFSKFVIYNEHECFMFDNYEDLSSNLC